MSNIFETGIIYDAYYTKRTEEALRENIEHDTMSDRSIPNIYGIKQSILYVISFSTDHSVRLCEHEMHNNTV